MACIFARILDLILQGELKAKAAPRSEFVSEVLGEWLLLLLFFVVERSAGIDLLSIEVAPFADDAFFFHGAAFVLGNVGPLRRQVALLVSCRNGSQILNASIGILMSHRGLLLAIAASSMVMHLLDLRDLVDPVVLGLVATRVRVVVVLVDALVVLVLRDSPGLLEVFEDRRRPLE